MKKYFIVIVASIIGVTSPLSFADDVTDTYSAGDTLTAAKMNNIKGAVNSKQNRVSGVCGPGSSIGAINSDGTVNCETDDGSTYNAGAGISINSFVISTVPGCDLGIGTVVSSLLSELAFQNIHGTDWVLSDGQDVTGSDYAVLTGRNTLPDFTGRFIRGAGGNAAPIAETQDFNTAAPAGFTSTIPTGGPHNHQYDQVLLSGSGVGGDGGTWRSSLNPGANTAGTGNHDHTINITGWDIETRPSNVTVNFFVRINNCT